MSLKTVSKLKLKTGATLRLATLRSSVWESEENIIHGAEHYIISKGENIRSGLAAEATRTWTLDNDNVPSSIASFSTGPVFECTHVVRPPAPPEPAVVVTYDGYRALNFEFANLPTTLGDRFSVNDGIIEVGGEVMVAMVSDDESDTVYMAYIYENPSVVQNQWGVYSMYISHVPAAGGNTWLNGAYDDSTDPYDDDSDGNNGGDGDDTNEGDIIGDPGLPDIGAIDSGLINLYTATPAQLRNLAAFLWSGLFDVNTFKKIFSNPMEAILGLSLVPVNIPSVAQGSVRLGNIDTGVQMGIVSAQYVKVKCGSIDVKEYWGSYLDYSPTTKFDIYLPFVGVRPLRTDDIMKKTLSVVYNVDILSGACVCFIKSGGTVLYEYAGQCSTIIPINGQNWNSAISSAISLVGSLGLAVATGGGSAPLTAAQVAGKSAVAGAAIAGNVMNSKPNIERSGGIGSSAGILANLKPFLIITRPKACVPSNQNKFEGYPSYKTMRLSACSGYTEVESVHLDNISATDTEKKEIERLLYEGVII